MNNEALASTLRDALNKLQHRDVDKELLREKASEKPETISEQYFAFTLGERHFVVKANAFCEVFTSIPIAPVPNAPQLLAGLCNLRSELVPVYQLHSLLHLPLPAKRIVFCIGRGDKTLGILVNDLPFSLALSALDRITPGDTADDDPLREVIQHHYFFRQRLYHFLDGCALGEQLSSLATRHKPLGRYSSSDTSNAIL